MKSFSQFLTELHGIKKHYGAESLGDILESYGWKEIGSGKYASVWENSKHPFVLKTWIDDEPYEDYLKYIMKHPNPHAPKVIGRIKSIPAVYKRTTKHETVKIAKIEKLYPLTDEKVWEAVRHVLETSRLEGFDRQEQIEYDEKGRFKQRNWIDSDITKVLPQAKSILDFFTSLPDIGHVDIHKSNVMQRKDGTIVLIDPFWWDTTYNLYHMYKAERDAYDMDDYYDEEPEIFDKPHYLVKDKPKPEINLNTFDPDSDIPF